MRRSPKFPYYLATAVLLVSISHARPSAASVLWRIGTPDGSYRELAVAGNYPQFPVAFPNDVDFRIGRSVESKDWPFIQPGPGDQWAGRRVHPFRIRFNLDDVPSAPCRLLVHLVDTQAGSPILEVAINGQKAYRFDTEPGVSDDSLTNPHAGRHSTLAVAFPSSLLKAGENSITLSVVGDRSWILYDAVVLESGPEIPAGPVISGMAVAVDARTLSATVRFRNAGCEGDVEWAIEGGPSGRVHVLPGPNIATIPLSEDQIMRKLTLTAGSSAATVVLTPPRALWKIGATDRSYFEFAMAGHYFDYHADFPRDVNYVVGASRPEKDWPFIHPGPDDSTWAGGRRHPFRVNFSLPARPIGVHAIVVNMVDTQPRANSPVLEVDVNGRQKMRCVLPSGASDASLKDPRAGRPYRLTIPFPAGYLDAGPNYIVLTVVQGSWLLYDSVSLETGLPVPDTPQLSSVQAATTDSFREEGGFRRQVVEVRVANGGAAGPAVIRIAGGGDVTRNVSLAPGVNVLEILVPPLDRPAPLKVTVTGGGEDHVVWIEGLAGKG